MLTTNTTELCRILAIEMFEVLLLYFNIQDTVYYIRLADTEARVKILGVHTDIKTHTAVYSAHYTAVDEDGGAHYVQNTVIGRETYRRSIKQT